RRAGPARRPAGRGGRDPAGGRGAGRRRGGARGLPAGRHPLARGRLAAAHALLAGAWRPPARLPRLRPPPPGRRLAAGPRPARPPASGSPPTSRWSPGESMEDIPARQLPASVPSGPSQMVAGLYDLASVQPLPVAQPGASDSSRVLLATLEAR